MACGPSGEAPITDGTEPGLERLPPGTRDRVASLRDRLARTPDSPGLFLDLAMTLHANGEADAAADVYEDVLRLQPDNLVARYLRSHALRASGDPAAAAEELERCLSAGAVPAAPLRTAATWALEDGELDKALVLATRAFERSPDAPGVRATKARIELAAGDPDAAAETLASLPRGEEPYLEYLASRVEAAASGSGSGTAPVEEPRWPDPWLEELDRYRGGTEASLREARAALASSNPKRAIEILEPLHRWESSDPRVYQTLAAAHRQAGEPARAVALLEAALRRQPGIFETRVQLVTSRYHLALASQDGELLEEAVLEAEELRTGWPEDWRSHALAGDVLHAAGDDERAFEAYSRCSTLGKLTAARCEYKAARALLRLDRAREARALLIGAYGDAPEAADVARLLDLADRALFEAG